MQALIVATGPSLTREDVTAWSEGRIVYAVNDAYRYCSWINIIYACDEEWWDYHEADTRYIEDRWTTNEQAALKYGLNHIPGESADAARKYFDASGHGIIYGGNGGFQALNLAYVHGCRDAVLLGFDLGHAPGEPKHCFGDHPPEIDRPSPYRAWIDHWNKAAPWITEAGMTVRNATRGGNLEAFERVSL